MAHLSHHHAYLGTTLIKNGSSFPPPHLFRAIQERRESAFFKQSRLMILVTVVNKDDEVALCSYCKRSYVFNIWCRCFYFYISRYCTALLKAVSFIDLNPLGACIAEKQQSDEKLSKKEIKQSLIKWWQPI